MPVGNTLLTSNYDNVDRTSYPTASISPAAYSVLVVDVMLAAATTAGTPIVADSLSGGSLAWTTIQTDLDGGRSTGSFWAACGGAPGSGVITITWSGGDATHTGCGWFVRELTGVDQNNPIVQFKFAGGDGTTSTTPTVTLDNAIGDAANRVLMNVSHRLNAATAPRTNWTEQGDHNAGAPNMGFECQWRNDGTNETTASATIGSARFAILAYEMRSEPRQRRVASVLSARAYMQRAHNW